MLKQIEGFVFLRPKTRLRGRFPGFGRSKQTWQVLLGNLGRFVSPAYSLP